MDFATILKLASDNEVKLNFINRRTTHQHTAEFVRQVGVVSSTIRMFGSSGEYATTEQYKDFYWIDVDDYEEEDFKLGDISVDNICKLKEGLVNLGLSELSKKLTSDSSEIYDLIREELAKQLDKEKLYKGKRCWNTLPIEEKRLHWIKSIQANPEVIGVPCHELKWVVDSRNMTNEEILEDYFKTEE